jgi:hypothetical protein
MTLPGARVGRLGAPDESLVHVGEVVRIGAELKHELEFAAREESADATWLARKILREWLAAGAPE